MGRTKRESTAATLALSGRLGDLVDQWKYDNKKTQEELAKEIGVRASSLSDWINDSSTPTIDQLYKVAKFFDVPADYLIGLSNVQTLNTNLQATEKLTRLTGKAIERLGYNPKFKPMSPEEAERAIKEKKLKRRAWTDEEIALLSQMIEDDSLLKIISHINNYRKWAKMDAFKRTRYRLTGEREEGMSIGIKNDLIFTRADGAPFDPHSITSWFSKFLKANDLTSTHFHSLRHSNATLLIADHVPVSAVSGRLGHANILTTLNIYTSAIQSADAAAANSLESTFERIKEKNHA